MNSSYYSDISEEEEDQNAEKCRKEVEIKNAELKRHQDDLRKEKSSSSYEGSNSEKSTEYTREWDRGKSDKNNCLSPDHQGSSKSYRSGCYGKRNEDRQDKSENYSRNVPGPSHGYKLTGHRENRKRNDQHGSSYYNPSPKRLRGVEYENMSDFKKMTSRKNNSRRRGSLSSSTNSDSSVQILKLNKLNVLTVLNCNDAEVIKNAQYRIKIWLESVEKANAYYKDLKNHDTQQTNTQDKNQGNAHKEYPAGDTWADYDDNQQTNTQNKNQSNVHKEYPAGDTWADYDDNQQTNFQNKNQSNVYKEYPAGDTWDDYDDNQQTYSQNENQSIVSKEQPAIIVAGGDTHKHNESQVKLSSKSADLNMAEKECCIEVITLSSDDEIEADMPAIGDERRISNAAKKYYSDGEVVSSDDDTRSASISTISINEL